MERIIYRLTARQVMHLRPPKGKKAARFCDGGNMYLQTTRGKDGHVSRSWTFRYEIAGRRRGNFAPVGAREGVAHHENSS
jgi:hypothetical protein